MATLDIRARGRDPCGWLTRCHAGPLVLLVVAQAIGAGAAGCGREQRPPAAVVAIEPRDDDGPADGKAPGLNALPAGATARLGHRERGMVPLAFSADGSRLATAQTHPRSQQDAIHLWDVATGKSVGVLQGHASQVMSGAFAPDSRSFASGGIDGVLILWDLATGKPVARESLEPHVYQVAFLPDGKHLLSASRDLLRWGLPPRRAAAWKVPTFERGVSDFALAPDGNRVVTIGVDVELWDLTERQRIRVLCEHKDRPEFHSFAFTPDNKVIVGYDSNTGAVRRWDAAIGAALPDGAAKLPRSLQKPPFSPDARCIAILYAHGDPAIEIRDVATGQVRCRIPTGGGQGASFRFSPDSKTLAVGEWQGGLWLYNTNDGKRVRSFLDPMQPVVALHVNAGGETVRSFTAEPGLVSHDWNVTERAQVRQRPFTAPVADRTLRFSPDGKMLATVDAQGQLEMWDLVHDQRLWTAQHQLSRHPVHRRFDRHDPVKPGVEVPRVVLLEFASDGRSLAGLTAGLGEADFIEDARVTVWDAATGQVRGHVRDEYLRCLAIGPAGKVLMVATSLGAEIYLTDVGSGKQTAKLRMPQRPRGDDHIHAMVFSPDGTRLAAVEQVGVSDHMSVAYHDEIRLWALGAAPSERLIPAAAATMPVFSADGATLAFGLASGKDPAPPEGKYWPAGVAVWDVGRGKLGYRGVEAADFNVPRVAQLAFAPDGKTLATSGGDRTILIWDVPRLFRPR